MPLTVADLMSINSEGARFAFLAAGHSANIRDARLLDEAIDLTSAMLVAGYPSVIGNLWQVGDE
jgi:CHAT domain-containing protein